MKIVNDSSASCRHCRFYRPEGRRGGVCQKLSVPVNSNWEACVLASPPFPNSLKKLEEIVHLETAFYLKYADNSPVIVDSNPEEIVATTTNKIL